jgi:hypothetical protein
MPQWVLTLAVGLGAGVVGTLLSTMLRISHERGAELRSRMLEAADEFVGAASDAVSTSHRASLQTFPLQLAGHRLSDDVADPLIEQAVASIGRAREALAEVQRRQPRIRLLFGVDSDAGMHAENASNGVAVSVLAFMDRSPRTEDALNESWSRVQAALGTAEASINDFSRAARNAIEGRRRRGRAAQRIQFAIPGEEETVSHAG